MEALFFVGARGVSRFSVRYYSTTTILGIVCMRLRAGRSRSSSLSRQKAFVVAHPRSGHRCTVCRRIPVTSRCTHIDSVKVNAPFLCWIQLSFEFSGSRNQNRDQFRGQDWCCPMDNSDAMIALHAHNRGSSNGKNITKSVFVFLNTTLVNIVRYDSVWVLR